MLIVCPHCLSPLRVRTSRQIVDGVRDYYCTCDNENCLARPVMTMSHKHDVQPPIHRHDELSMIMHALKDLPISKKQVLLTMFQQQLSEVS